MTIVEQGIKRKALSDITDNVTSPSEFKGSSNNGNNLHITTPPNVPQRIVTAALIGDYFVRKDTKILFNCAENEYLSQMIDCFDDILSRKSDISKILHSVE